MYVCIYVGIDTRSYRLGPPIMNSAEHGDIVGIPRGCGDADHPCDGRVYDPTFELTYWKFGLRTAANWSARLGHSPPPGWTDALLKLDSAPTVASPWNQSQRLYNLHAACVNLYHGRTLGCAERSDHPGHLMAMGVLPGLSLGIDFDIMNATFTATQRVWDLEHGYYGTDPHLMAISATRLRRPTDAVHFVLLDSDENRSGHTLTITSYSQPCLICTCTLVSALTFVVMLILTLAPTLLIIGNNITFASTLELTAPSPRLRFCRYTHPPLASVLAVTLTLPSPPFSPLHLPSPLPSSSALYPLQSRHQTDTPLPRNNHHPHPSPSLSLGTA